MFLVAPGLTDAGIVTRTPTEYVDLMPTLAELAFEYTVPACPDGNTSTVQLCTHGVSLVPLITDPFTPVRKAAYSQYPRGWKDHATSLEVQISSSSGGGGSSSSSSVTELGGLAAGGVPSPSACLHTKCTMGYSLLTNVGGVEYRYTEWAGFNSAHFGKPDWTHNVGRELYNHSSDPLENFNIATADGTTPLEQGLSALLKQHPTTL